MIASLDEAIDILSKWANERVPLSAVFVADGLMFSFDGFIAHLNSEVVVVTNRQPDSGNLTLSLGKILDSNYKETKSAPKAMSGDLSRQFVSCLMLKMVSGECLLYELVV